MKISKILTVAILSYSSSVMATNNWFIETGGQITRAQLGSIMNEQRKTVSKADSYGFFVGLGNYLTEDISVSFNLKYLNAMKSNSNSSTKTKRSITNKTHTANITTTIFSLDFNYDFNKFSYYDLVPYAKLGLGVGTYSVVLDQYIGSTQLYGKKVKSNSGIFKIGFGLNKKITENASLSLGYEKLLGANIKYTDQAIDKKVKMKADSLLFSLRFKL